MSAADARGALGVLRNTLQSGAADGELQRFGVGVLTVFGSALDESCDDPGDLDIAVLPQRGAGRFDVVAVINWLIDLTEFDDIDLAVLSGDNPVLDARALCGLPLYEASRGDWAKAQMAALGIYWDTQKFRDLELARLASIAK